MDFASIFNYQSISLALVILGIGYFIFIKPRLMSVNALTPDQMEFLDTVIKKGIIEANKAYESSNKVDRVNICIDYAIFVIGNSEIIPVEYLPVIKTMIKKQVNFTEIGA